MLKYKKRGGGFRHRPFLEVLIIYFAGLTAEAKSKPEGPTIGRNPPPSNVVAPMPLTLLL
jgi:hypothetical protein